MRHTFHPSTPSSSPRPARSHAACRAIPHRPERLERRDLLTTFTVHSPADDGPGTLREAIVLANASPGHDTVRFHLPGTTVTIAPLTPLPDITDPVTLDGAFHGTHPDGTPMVRVMPRYSGPADTFRLVGASGSVVRGLAVFGTASAVRVVGGSDVAIEGNHIGYPGAADAPYGWGDGVVLEGATAARVGGTAPGQRNVISGTTIGVAVRPGEGHPAGTPFAADHVIQGNYFGTDAAGDVRAEMPNSRAVDITGSTGTLVGGASPAARNVIAGSDDAGVYITNGQAFIRGNYFGTDAAGRRAIRGSRAVFVTGRSSGNVIGGSAPGEGNVISGHHVGVFFFGEDVDDNVISGNLIGLNAAGTGAIHNTDDNVLIGHGDRNVIGGDTPASRNVISASRLRGVNISLGVQNVVRNNYIGTDVTGRRAVGNDVGVVVSGSGDDRSLDNVVSDNLISGNRVGAHVGGARTLFRRNLVGTDATGAAALPNREGGVAVTSAGADIGGPGAEFGNVISGNGGYGVWLAGATIYPIDSAPNLVRSNRIGVAAGTAGGPGSEGAPLGNGGPGVLAYWTRSADVYLNTIAHNNGPGVVVSEGAPRVAIFANSIHSNAGPGIELAPTDRTDALPNDLQPAPVLTSVGVSDKGTTIRGTLQSAPSTRHVIEFFSNPPDAGGPGPSEAPEGAEYLGGISVTTDAAGRAGFIAAGSRIPEGAVVTATATRILTVPAGQGQTSQFSAPATAPAPDVTAPRVTGVFVRGRAWGQPFLEYLARSGLGSATFGYAPPTDPSSGPPLPWSGVDEISVRFTEPVFAASFSSPFLSTRYETLTVASTRFDPTTNTMTWTLERPLEADAATIRFNGGMFDLAGNLLDAEWAPGQDFPSGDGTAGGDFQFPFDALPGDTTADGRVLAEDYAEVKKRFFKNVDSQVTGGAADYTPFHDVDGNGIILAGDYAEVKKRFFTTLPETQVLAVAPRHESAAPPPGASILLDPRRRDVLADGAPAPLP